MRTLKIVLFALTAIALETIALALCDVAEALSQIGSYASKRAGALVDKKGKQ